MNETLDRRKNLVEFRTAWGYRTIELWQGDITDLPFSVDLLAVSAIAWDYTPTKSSVIGALARLGVSVRGLAERPECDFRQTSLGCWVSEPLSAPVLPPASGEGEPLPRFRRLLVVESMGNTAESVGRAFDNLFAVHAMLEQQGSDSAFLRTIALPALGGGDQGLAPGLIVDALVKAASRRLERSLLLERVIFVVWSESLARQFADAIEKKLGRVAVSVRAKPLDEARAAALAALRATRAMGTVAGAEAQVLDHLERLLSWEEAKSFELGIAGRRLAEVLVHKVLGKERASKLDLAKAIDSLAEHHVADWTRSYLHLLRIFGNNEAHQKHAAVRRPGEIDEQDLLIWLLSLRRVLDFSGGWPAT